MGILFGLQKKALLRKLQKAQVKAKKLKSVREKEAKQERELRKLQMDIKKASMVKLKAADRKILGIKTKERKNRIMKAKQTAKTIGSTSYTFAKKLGKFLDKNIAPPKVKRSSSKRKSKRRRSKSYY